MCRQAHRERQVLLIRQHQPFGFYRIQRRWQQIRRIELHFGRQMLNAFLGGQIGPQRLDQGILLALVLIYLTPKFSGAALFSLYVAGYSVGRFFIEGLRIDQAHMWGGLRLNQYVSLILFGAGLLAFSRFSRLKR